jgi:hypothetical protein
METLLEKILLSGESKAILPTNILQQLSEEINNLILTNFERLIQLLYRIDVSEQRLKQLLKEHPDQDAGFLIAGLIIERQAQKKKHMAEFSMNNADVPEEERW